MNKVVYEEERRKNAGGRPLMNTLRSFTKITAKKRGLEEAEGKQEGWREQRDKEKTITIKECKV